MPEKRGKNPGGGKDRRAQIEREALRILAERGDVREPVVVLTESDVDADGAELYRVTVAPREEPNAAHAAVVLDAKGEAVEPARLAALDLFRPPVFEVPPDEGDAAPAARPITIDPRINELTLRECQSFEEVVTVTVPKQPAAKADVYFLADTTGSMTSVIAAVKAGANSILNAPQFAGRDIVFGVGNYKDFPHDSYAFDHQLSPTANKPAVAAAINTWTASGGYDGAEGQLFALHRLATDPGIGWRPNSEKILVWFGDAPGHDPVCSAISGLGVDLTAASVEADLQAAGITVLAISTVTGFANGLDHDPSGSSSNYSGTCPINGGPGQATSFANATGGQHVTGINPANIVATIIALINAAVSTINNLNLVPSASIAPFVVGISPAGGYGPLPGDREHVLRFRVRFKGAVPCRKDPQTFFGSLKVVADSVTVAAKRVIITVPACSYNYSVKFVCGVQEREECQGEPVRPGIYATEINIHNPHACPAKIEKRVIPVVVDGKVIAREPEWSPPRGKDRILLPPDGATMDDCQRIGELLFRKRRCPMRLTVGFLAIRSNRPLEITAVYTASTLKGRLVSMDVESVDGRRF